MKEQSREERGRVSFKKRMNGELYKRRRRGRRKKDLERG
jgi:hypothetical protein